jgi:DNA-binding transcriptional MerR regulator
MGHRYYTDTYINLFKEIKSLKEQGFLLKAIKNLMPELLEGKIYSSGTPESISEVMFHDEKKGVAGENTVEQFRMMLGGIVSKAIEDNNEVLGKEVSSMVSDSVVKEMDYLLRIKEEREEERYKKFDEVLRSYQKNNREAAAAEEHRGLFGHRKKKTYM